jgi:transposase
MKYNKEYKVRAISYKEDGHTFNDLKKNFGVDSTTYYRWKKQLAETGSLNPNYSHTKLPRKSKKIDVVKLQEIVKEKPDLYLKELTKEFDCTPQAVFYRLENLKITLKKRHLHTLKNQKKSDKNI